MSNGTEMTPQFDSDHDNIIHLMGQMESLKTMMSNFIKNTEGRLRDHTGEIRQLSDFKSATQVKLDKQPNAVKLVILLAAVLALMQGAGMVALWMKFGG
jgi:hypothetical protein